jgi:phenylacetate-CoA ligase
MEKHKRTLLYPPKGIIVTAAVLSENVREYIENILRTRIYNQYGSREVGVIACECPKQDGLHIFDFFQYVEVIDPDYSGNGEIIVTNLRNYSMPLIRYRIGDTAKGKNSLCSCKSESHILEKYYRKGQQIILDWRMEQKLEGRIFSHLFIFKSW